MDTAVEYAQALSVKKLHCLSGRTATDMTCDAQQAIYESNLRRVTARVAEHGITITIEPICHEAVSAYFMSTYDHALRTIASVAAPNLRLQFDSFHAQLTHGRLTHLLTTHKDIIGHIQVSQVPGRREPDANGEINIPYLARLIDTTGYSSCVGLEFRPSTPLTATALDKPWFSLFTL